MRKLADAAYDLVITDINMPILETEIRQMDAA
jgi:hypothetical protein